MPTSTPADAGELADAFNELTPGRQREYKLHISGAGQAETRNRRVDTAIPRILDGKGLRDQETARQTQRTITRPAGGHTGT